MDKPVKKCVPRYDYHECSEYLQNKYEYEERDYYGKFKDGKVNENIPYADFWHWIISNDDTITNGCIFVMYECDGIDIPNDDFRKIILNHYMEEFGEGDIGDRKITFWIEW